MSCYRLKNIVVGEEDGGVSTPILTITRFYQQWLSESGASFQWTANSGQIPSDINNRFLLLRDGDELNYPGEYTIDTSTVVSSGYATITLVFGGVPGANYWARAIFENGT